MTTDKISASAQNDRIRNLQNISGGLFVLLYSLIFVIRILQYYGIVPYGMIWLNIATGALGLAGFILLSKLSSSMASDFYAASQIGFDVFFSVAIPVLIMFFDEDTDFYVPVLLLCIAFRILAIYFWSVLLNNNRFRLRDKPWIVMMPLMCVFHICHYFNCISRVYDTDTIVVGPFYDNDFMMALYLCLTIPMAVGYWKLSHSKAFSGPKDSLDKPKMSPANRYFMTYMIFVVFAYLIF